MSERLTGDQARVMIVEAATRAALAARADHADTCGAVEARAIGEEIDRLRAEVSDLLAAADADAFTMRQIVRERDESRKAGRLEGIMHTLRTVDPGRAPVFYVTAAARLLESMED